MKKKIIIGLCVAVLASGAAWWAAKPESIRVSVAMLLQPPEMAAAQYAKGDVVGNLGGVPVTIPRHFAEYVEYDGDPGFGEKHEGPVPVRTHESRLSSFGFYVRYPDMVGVSTPELRDEIKRSSLYKTMWIRVGVRSGEIYPGENSLDKLTHSQLETPNNNVAFANYEKLPNSEFGLTVYAPLGIDEKTGKPNREHRNAEDVFIYHNNDGKVIAFISCSNRPTMAAPCKHRINLEPFMQANVNIQYRRGLLPKWKGIHESVVRVIESFEVSK